ncbi:MAG: DUF3822 family protein [Prevotella sp.]|nr:DUF3822 family protein [Prevotella sp.]
MKKINTLSRLVIRIGKDTLSFSVIDNDSENQIIFEPYVVRSGISMAANLREAFTKSDLLMAGYEKVHAIVDSPVVLIPTAELNEGRKNEDDSDDENDNEGVASLLTDTYNHTISDAKNHVVLSHELTELGATALFSINKDLKLVVDDHFSDVRISPLMSSVWRYLYHRDFQSAARKLFVYRHEGMTDIFAYDHERFKFANSYRTRTAADTAYFILAVWNQLGFDSKRDEIHLAGFDAEKDELRTELSRFVETVVAINPSAEFNRAPITRIKGLPFDMMTLFVKK